MLKLIRKLLGVKLREKQVIRVEYTNRQLSQIKRAIAEGFKAVWNGAVWVLTKVIYV